MNKQKFLEYITAKMNKEINNGDKDFVYGLNYSGDTPIEIFMFDKNTMELTERFSVSLLNEYDFDEFTSDDFISVMKEYYEGCTIDEERIEDIKGLMHEKNRGVIYAKFYNYKFIIEEE